MSPAETRVLRHVEGGHTGTVAEIALRLAKVVAEEKRFNEYGAFRGNTLTWGWVGPCRPGVPLVAAAMASRGALDTWLFARAQA